MLTKPNCTTGYACGYTCIERRDQCHSFLASIAGTPEGLAHMIREASDDPHLSSPEQIRELIRSSLSGKSVPTKPTIASWIANAKGDSSALMTRVHEHVDYWRKHYALAADGLTLAKAAKAITDASTPSPTPVSTVPAPTSASVSTSHASSSPASSSPTPSSTSVSTPSAPSPASVAKSPTPSRYSRFPDAATIADELTRALGPKTNATTKAINSWLINAKGEIPAIERRVDEHIAYWKAHAITKAKTSTPASAASTIASTIASTRPAPPASISPSSTSTAAHSPASVKPSSTPIASSLSATSSTHSPPSPAMVSPAPASAKPLTDAQKVYALTSAAPPDPRDTKLWKYLGDGRIADNTAKPDDIKRPFPVLNLVVRHTFSPVPLKNRYKAEIEPALLAARQLRIQADDLLSAMSKRYTARTDPGYIAEHKEYDRLWNVSNAKIMEAEKYALETGEKYSAKVDPATLAERFTNAKLHAERLADFRAEHSELTDADIDYAEATLAKAMASDNVKLFTRIETEDVLHKILGSRFKTQYETGKASAAAMFSPTSRFSAEADAIFGEEYAKTSADERAVYGYLADGPENQKAYAYGKIVIQFKPDVKQRATHTVGDSLEGIPASPVLSPRITSGYDHAVKGDPGLMRNPKERAERAVNKIRSIGYLNWSKSPISDIEGLAMISSQTYVEAQIHGQVGPESIASVYFEAQKPSSATIAELNRRNIPVYYKGKLMSGSAPASPTTIASLTEPIVNESAAKVSRQSLMRQGISEQAIDAANTQLKGLLNHAKVYSRVSSEAIATAILNDRFKSQYEVKPPVGSVTTYNPVGRLKLETEKIFGPKYATVPINQRAIYGYFADNDQQAMTTAADYGDIVFEFKPEVKQRASYTIGDSLSGRIAASATKPEISVHAISLLHDAEAMVAHTSSAKDLAQLISGKFPAPYVEAQLQGGVTSKDIAAIHLSKQPSPEFKALADAKGIKLIISGS